LSRSRSLAVALVAAGTLMPIIPSSAGAAVRFGDRTLEEGAKGQDVRVLQDFLTRAGVATPVDGRFGAGTARRVRTWERGTVHAAGASSGARAAGGVRLDGRLTPTESKVLRDQVAKAETGGTPAAATPAPAPATEKATIGPDGLAVAPASAPEPVKRIIAAGNEIHDKPYKYGGGHAAAPNRDSGYDCSGSMSYAFQGAGLLEDALDSSGFAAWGRSGPGQWVTTYANSGHSFMIVAGLRFDTSGRADAGSRWQTRQRSTSGYTVRHPKGL
jgi:hypothetical protein